MIKSEINTHHKKLTTTSGLNRITPLFLVISLIIALSIFLRTYIIDFHHSSTSDLIDKGTTLPEVTNDFDSIARPYGVSYDVGAYEYKP